MTLSINLDNVNTIQVIAIMAAVVIAGYLIYSIIKYIRQQIELNEK